MRHLILITILFITYNATAQMTDAEKDAVRHENLAQKDYYNKEMKYYTFGMVDTDAGDTMKKFILKRYYHIELRHMGCIMDRSLVAYNKKVESIIQRRYKVDLWKAVQQKKDSINSQQ